MPNEIWRTREGFFVLALVTILLCDPLGAQNQQQPPTPVPSLDDTLQAGDEELFQPAKNLVKWNEYNGDKFTFRFGAGFLYEYSGFAQDRDSKEQVELHPQWKVRDARFILKGSLKTDRPISFSSGIL